MLNLTVLIYSTLVGNIYIYHITRSNVFYLDEILPASLATIISVFISFFWLSRVYFSMKAYYAVPRAYIIYRSGLKMACYLVLGWITV